MKKVHAIFSVVAIALGFLFLVYALSQLDIDVGRKMAKWEKATSGYVQEILSEKVSKGD